MSRNELDRGTTVSRRKLSTRARKRRATIRRDPLGRVCIEVGRYLETVGWRAVVMGQPRISGFYKGEGLARDLEFSLRFSGGKIIPKPTKGK